MFRVRNVRQPALVYLNGSLLSHFWGRRVLSKLDMTLGADVLAVGRNVMEICLAVDPGEAAARAVELAVSFYAFGPARVLAGPRWFRQSEAHCAPRGNAVPLGPVAWETENPKAPVFFVPDGLKKGEVWLNGRMVSRYGDIGPQKKAYLPERWLTGRNRLVVFDEFGASPSGVRLEHDDRAILSRKMI